jgi:hypothetical protein
LALLSRGLLAELALLTLLSRGLLAGFAEFLVGALLTELLVVSFVRHHCSPRVSPSCSVRKKPAASANRSARAPVDATNRRH